MVNKNSRIEINGKLYDAVSGKPLAHHSSPKPATPKARLVSDMTSPHHRKVHATLQRSKTLMRNAVKKPSSKKPQITNSQIRLMNDFSQPSGNSLLTPTPGTLHHDNDAARFARARKIKRSQLVSKFSSAAVASSPSTFAPADIPVKQRVEAMPVHPAPAHAAPKSKTHSIIEKGLRNAQSHESTHHATHHKKPASKRGRLARMAAGGLAVLLLGTFIAYQNVPNITVRYAAARSGVSAKLPAYQPAGFTLNRHIQYSPGQITVNFKSNTDERAYTITQRESTWNSDTLMSSYVASEDDKVQTYEDKGRTIYLYGDSSATWVNAGVWYDINGNSQLTSDQLIRIATSM